MSVPIEDMAGRIHTILMDCLFRKDELDGTGMPKSDFTRVDGIRQKVGLHPERLKAHKEEIRSLLNEMDPRFHRYTGGGWSFLNLCVDKHGRQWGEHVNCEELIILGIATKMAQFPLPREAWEVLPGGMPYVVFDTTPDGGF